MSRVPHTENIRVEVTPDEWGIFDQSKREAQLKSRAYDLQKAINRHIDDLGSVAVTWDVVVKCSFCEYAFHEDETYDRLPLCCDEAQIEFVTAHPDYTGPDADDVASVRENIKNGVYS